MIFCICHDIHTHTHTPCALKKVSETLSNSNGHIQTYEESSGEDKPMLQVKMNGTDDQGINALINRQLQGKQLKHSTRKHTQNRIIPIAIFLTFVFSLVSYLLKVFF